MIFVTVGSQMAFDRLIAAVDSWADARERADVFAQIGPSSTRPNAIRWTRFVEPSEFRERVRQCDALVAHAGMGSILTALEFGKPVLVMPRRASLGETRNDHQIATARRLRAMGKVHVAMDEHEMPRMLDRLGELRASEPIRHYASDVLISAIRSFIHGVSIPVQAVEPKRVADPLRVVVAPGIHEGSGVPIGSGMGDEPAELEIKSEAAVRS